MKITDDRHFVNDKYIANGWANLDVHSIRIDRYFTESEMTENFRKANSYSKDEWTDHCENFRKELSDKVYKLLCELEKQYIIYQFRKDDDILYSSMKWDLYFWCNWENGERDYSYVTLTFKKESTLEDRLELLEKLKTFFAAYNENNIQAIIQYDMSFNDDIIIPKANAIYEKIKDKFVSWFEMEGKIKKLEGRDGYYFFKKRARNNCYHISDIDILNYFG